MLQAATEHPKPSAVPVPVHLVPHETSFCPGTTTQVVLQSLSVVQKQVPAAWQEWFAVLQPPREHT